MASADSRKELECALCLNIYTDPVTLKCGHNFCRNCIGHVLDIQQRSGGYSCPECREDFQQRPALRRNITLRNLVHDFLSAQPDQKSTYCIQTSMKSLLVCEASLCHNHLKFHSKSPKHVLCGPTAPPENRECSVHKEVLKFYCTKDSTCICLSCRLDEEHWGHHVETLDEASKIRKKKLRNVLKKLMPVREEIENGVQSLQERRSKVQETADDETEKVTALFGDLRGRLENLEKRVLSEISGQADRVCLLLSDMIQQLLIKEEELSRKMGDIEELCNMKDSLTVLQKSGRGGLCDIEVGDNREARDGLLHEGVDLDVAWISHTLHTGLSDIVSGVVVQKPTGTRVYPHSVAKGKVPLGVTDLLLDVSTAGNNIYISDDRTTASSSSNQNRPETPERFQYDQVISSQSLSSGRHFWEVNVGGSECWIVGMCYPSIDRKGCQSVIGYNQKSWGLERFGGNQYSLIHDRKKIQITGNISSNRVMIYLDYQAGRISFYELCDPIRPLITFTTTFTEPLHVGLLVGSGSCMKISEGKWM
ncbi:E3 ubiquitin-protein ligase TRIM39-like [Rana temporaria]|uniref:E3 ubiquitin-protein ligase TRIM39-like n=1 Tax=Rana temporaria TaxID=8407 RepID=UPI001AACBB3C|nr:E3 ubiquitin-protein ligase TRIM39-like [Rana temporaria]